MTTTSTWTSRLADARASANLSRADVANLLDVSSQTVKAWEVGERLPHPRLIATIAQVYELDEAVVYDLYLDVALHQQEHNGDVSISSARTGTPAN